MDCGYSGDASENQPSQKFEMPKAALAVMDAIKKNRAAQTCLKSRMKEAELSMKKVKDLIKRAKIISEFDIEEKRKMARRMQDERVLLISVPNKDQKLASANKYQKLASANKDKKLPSAKKDKKLASGMIHGPPENSRAIYFRWASEEYPQWITKERWTKEECRNLKKGIIQQLQQSMDRMDESDFQVGAEVIRSFLPNVDWEDVVSTYLPSRSARECEARWVNVEDPLINHGEWTGLEDKSLLVNIQQMGHNWVAVAEALGTNRIPFQCLMRYQRSLNPSIIKSEWTPAEDDSLATAVQTHGESNWAVVASALEGRTGPQCSNRWMKSLLPSKQRKGRWSEDEDKRLKVAVTLLGSKCWNKISEFVPGRTQARCRERWVNCLDSSLKHGKWTKEESAMLEEAVGVHGHCWAKVAMCVPPRTDCQCRRRWNTLFPADARRVQAERKVAKAVLPSNFVDRAPDRSTLGPKDFVGFPLEDAADALKEGKKRATRGSGIKQKRRADSNIADSNKSVKGARKKRKRQVNETTKVHQPELGSGSGDSITHRAQAGSDVADSSKPVKGARKKRKGRANETAQAGSSIADSSKSAKGARKRSKGRTNESAQAGSNIADSSKSVNGARKKRKGRVNGTTRVHQPELGSRSGGSQSEATAKQMQSLLFSILDRTMD